VAPASAKALARTTDFFIVFFIIYMTP